MDPWWTQNDDEPAKSLPGTAIDDDVIFHYTNADTLKKILKSGNIRLSPLSRTNDPLERREWAPYVLLPMLEDGADSSTLSLVDEQIDVIREVTDHHLRRGARLACFCQDREPSDDSLPFSHFHRGWARARMWDQYGDEHSGACVVFRKNDLAYVVGEGRTHEEGDVYVWGNVIYRDAPTTTVLNWDEIREHGIDQVLDREQSKKFAATELYLRKVRDWESEQEYRLVHVRWDAPADEIDAPLDVSFASTLTAVILGEAFPEDEVDLIRELVAQYPDVEIWRCRWETGDPTLFPA